jgi:hypothetical protein
MTLQRSAYGQALRWEDDGSYCLEDGGGRCLHSGRFAADDARQEFSALEARFSPDGSLLVAQPVYAWSEHRSSRIQQDVFVWDTASGRLRLHLEGPCNAFGFSPDGRWLALGRPQHLQLLSVPSCELTNLSLETEHEQYLVCSGTGFSFCPCSEYIAYWQLFECQAEDFFYLVHSPLLHLWRTRDRAAHGTIRLPASPDAVDWTEQPCTLQTRCGKSMRRWEIHRKNI